MMSVKYNWLKDLTLESAENSFKKGGVIPVPDEETFEQILDRARNGNEMAALHIFEWQEYCAPENDRDTEIVKLIKNAANQLFE